MVAHSIVAKLGLASGFLSTRTSPRGCLRVLTTWRLASPSARSPETKSELNSALCDLALEATHCHF